MSEVASIIIGAVGAVGGLAGIVSAYVSFVEWRKVNRKVAMLEDSGAAFEVVPAWYTSRMMDDFWLFGLQMNNGRVIAVNRIDGISSDGIWMDVTLATTDEVEHVDQRYGTITVAVADDRRSASVRCPLNRLVGKATPFRLPQHHPGPDITTRTVLDPLINDDFGFLPHLEGASLQPVVCLEHTLDDQVVEIFETRKATEPLSALFDLVIRVECVERVPVLVIKADTVIDDREALDRRLPALQLLLKGAMHKDVYPSRIMRARLDRLDCVYNRLNERRVDVCARSDVLDGTPDIDIAHTGLGCSSCGGKALLVGRCRMASPVSSSAAARSNCA